jgi:LuxR family maltose regulon positive regulatory protein
MPQVIQKTKLFIPPARAQSVERTRLLEKVDRLLEEICRAAVFSAPAGFDKTTLTVQWLSLDECDNLPARFFSYLIAALQAVAPDAGQEALPLLELPRREHRRDRHPDRKRSRGSAWTVSPRAG